MSVRDFPKTLDVMVFNIEYGGEVVDFAAIVEAMTRTTLSLAALAFALVAPALASAQDVSTREVILAELEAECAAMLESGDARAVDCAEALADARRTTNPVAVARIARQYAQDVDAMESTTIAARVIDAEADFDLFDEPADAAW